MSVDVRDYLLSKGLTLKQAGYNEVHTACPFCGEDPSKRGRLYVNIDPDAQIPGLFFCHICGEKGNLTTLKRHFGDKISESDEQSENTRAILHVSAEFYHEQLEEDVFRYLRGRKRGLTTETIEKHKIGYAPMELSWDVVTKTMSTMPTQRLFTHLKGLGYSEEEILNAGVCRKNERGYIRDSFEGMITIPYHVAGNVVQIRGRTWPFSEDDWDHWDNERYKPPPMKYKTAGGGSTRLFNTDVTWDAEELIITEGEFDALVLEQEGYRAVGAPGAKSWQNGWDGYLRDIRRVFLLYDRDEAGEDGAKKLVERFGPKIRRIFLSDEGYKCDPTKWFHEDGHSQAEFDDLLAAARRGGLLVSVHDAIEEFQERQGMPGLKFNFELLDYSISPGLQAAQLMIPLAKTGTGKTIWLLNQMQRMRMYPGQEDLKFLFLSLEQTRGEWWDRARRMYRFYHPEERDDRAARDWWMDNIFIVDKNRITTTELNQILDDFDYRMGQLPDCMFLDYLGYWAQGFRGERYERVSDAVMGLKGWCKDTLVPTIAPHQVSRAGKDGEEFGSDGARDSGVIEETADYVLTLWSPDNSLGRAEEEKTGDLRMRIAKSRHGGKGKQLNMQWGPLSLVMVPEGDRRAAAARREFVWAQTYRDNWERAAYRHRTGVEGSLENVPEFEFEQGGLL